MAQLHPLPLWLWANRKHEFWVLPYSFWQQTALLFPTSLSLHTFASAVCLPMTLSSPLFSTDPKGSGSNSSSLKCPLSSPNLHIHEPPWHLVPWVLVCFANENLLEN